MRPSVEYIKQLGSAPYDICQVFARLVSFHSEEHGFPSYRSVQGEGVRDIPDHTPLSQRTWPVYNESRRDLADAVLAAERLGRKFFQPDKKDQFGVLSRDYMIEGSTLPIRVTYTHDVPQGRKRAPRHQIHSLFIKEMNLNRVFLSRLYHLATGQPDPLMFSESSIVEPEIHGQTLQQYYATNKDYWKDSRNRAELVRLTVLAYFLSLDDMDNGANQVVVQNRRLEVIDFDKAFFHPQSDPREAIINPFCYIDGKTKELTPLPDEKVQEHFSEQEWASLVDSAQAQIHHNIRANIDQFTEVIEAMAHVPFYNAAAHELHGAKDVVAFYLKRLSEMKPKE